MAAISCGKRPLFFIIHIMLVFALWAAKYIIGSAGDESLLTMLAEAQRFFLISQHKAEHELNCR